MHCDPRSPRIRSPPPSHASPVPRCLAVAGPQSARPTRHGHPARRAASQPYLPEGQSGQEGRAPGFRLASIVRLQAVRPRGAATCKSSHVSSRHCAAQSPVRSRRPLSAPKRCVTLVMWSRSLPDSHSTRHKASRRPFNAGPSASRQQDASGPPDPRRGPAGRSFAERQLQPGLPRGSQRPMWLPSPVGAPAAISNAIAPCPRDINARRLANGTLAQRRILPNF